MHRLISSPRRFSCTNHVGTPIVKSTNKGNVGGHKEACRSIDRWFAVKSPAIGITLRPVMQLCRQMGSKGVKVRLTFVDRRPIDLRAMNLNLGIFISTCPLPLDADTIWSQKGLWFAVLPLFSRSEHISTSFDISISELRSRLDSGELISFVDAQAIAPVSVISR